MPTFILGAGFNVDATEEAGPIIGESLYIGRHRIDCGYPLVGDAARLCFDLDSVPPGASIEEFFLAASERNDYAPLSKLADRLREADHYIALQLASEEKANNYRMFFQSFAGNSFLTFNYDSLPETFLFHLGCWYPHDGYGVPVTVSVPPNAEEFTRKRSTSLVLHLHGSLSIRTSEFETLRQPSNTMEWLVEREQPLFAFDPMSISSNFAPIGRVVGSDNVSERIVAPVPDKSHGLKEAFVKEIYAKALNVVRNSEAVVAIGYSFNTHDSASYEPILRALGESRERRLLIVSPDSPAVARRLHVNSPSLGIESVSLTFKDWMAASCPGLRSSR